MKSIFKSKTFWFNLIGGIAEVSGYLPSNIYTMISMAAANVVLRTMSNQAVSIPVINPNPAQVGVTTGVTETVVTSTTTQDAAKDMGSPIK